MRRQSGVFRVRTNASRLLRDGLVCAFALALLAGIFLPVYSDEIGWRFQERAGIDGVDKLFSDLCGPNTLAAPPLFMMPVRYFSAYLNLWFADPLYVRLSGILYALVWLAMLLALVRRVAEHPAIRLQLAIFAVGLMALANMPLLLIWSRPEQPLLLSATAAMFLAFADRKGRNANQPSRDTQALAAWLRAAAILGLAAIAMSYHLKGVFLLPLFLACLFFSSQGPKSFRPRVAVSIVLAGLSAAALSYWFNRLNCPDDPILRAFYGSHSFGANLSDVDGVEGILGLVGRLIANINLWGYIQLAAPSPEPEAFWLPAGQISAAAAGRWNIFLAFFWLATGLMTVAALIRGVVASWSARRLDPRIVLSVIALGTAVAWSATQLTRNVYEAALIVPLLMFSAVLAISSWQPKGRVASLREGLAMYLGVGAIGSMVLIAALWAPSLGRSNAQTGYIAEQRHSIPVFGHSALRPDILGAARQCGMPEAAQANSLLIDEQTYFAFMESRLPQHHLGVLGLWKGTIDDPVAYLESRKSDGMILGCHLLPKHLRERARSQGQFCCLSPVEWGGK